MTDAYIWAIGGGLCGLLILFITLDARRRLTGNRAKTFNRPPNSVNIGRI